MKYLKIFCVAALWIIFSLGCTKLNEKFQGDLTPAQVSGGGGAVDALLNSVYVSMQITYQDQSNYLAMSEMTTDELIGPTRGPDWDDNGVWRVLHAHAWDGDNLHIRECFDQLSSTVFAATDLLRYSPTPAQAAEARFLRAFSMFNQLDGWDQVPYRDPGESVIIPSRVRKGTEALDYIISQLTDSIIPFINDAPPVYKGNKDAAKVLLMKCYLNRGVIVNRASPTFDPTDMAKVISLADEITATGRYSLNANYYDNFAPTNDVLSKENIFTFQRIGGQGTGGGGNTVNSRWHLTMHYKQAPSGWNGFTTLSDFYGKFEDGDQRKGVAYPAVSGPANPGHRVNVGFMIGQQYDLTEDTALTDRSGNPLVFTPEVKLIETGNNLEVTGIRVNKYPVDYPNDGSNNVDNDYVYYRYSDVLLMKAEALLRTSGAGALEIVNEIRAVRGASPLATLSLDDLLDERGRELYWEDFRRQDLIRFGKFLETWQEKTADDPKYLLLTIPNTQLAVNPNLKQNPGY